MGVDKNRYRFYSNKKSYYLMEFELISINNKTLIYYIFDVFPVSKEYRTVLC